MKAIFAGFSDKVEKAKATKNVEEMLRLARSIKQDSRLRQNEIIVAQAAAGIITTGEEAYAFCKELRTTMANNILIRMFADKTERVINSPVNWYNLLMSLVCEGDGEKEAERSIRKTTEGLFKAKGDGLSFEDLLEYASQVKDEFEDEKVAEFLEDLIISLAILLIENAEDAAALANSFGTFNGHHKTILAYVFTQGKIGISDANILISTIEQTDFSGKEAILAIFQATKSAILALIKQAKYANPELLKEMSRLIIIGVVGKKHEMAEEIDKIGMMIIEIIVNKVADVNAIIEIIDCIPTTRARHLLLLSYIGRRGVRDPEEVNLLKKLIFGNKYLGAEVKFALIDASLAADIPIDIEKIMNAAKPKISAWCQTAPDDSEE